MAVVPLFVIGPNAVLSLIGHIRGPKPVQEPDPAAIRELDVDVVIPAYNERSTIALCLASVMRQTLKPNSVTVIDDGSDDDTAAVAQAFAVANDFAIRVIRRRRSIGRCTAASAGVSAMRQASINSALTSPRYVQAPPRRCATGTRRKTNSSTCSKARLC